MQLIEEAVENIDNFKEKFSLSSLLSSRSRGLQGSSSRLSLHTLQSLIISITVFRLGEVPSNSTKDPQCNIELSSSTSSNCSFSPFAFASKACLKVFPEAFCLYGLTI